MRIDDEQYRRALADLEAGQWQAATARLAQVRLTSERIQAILRALVGMEKSGNDRGVAGVLELILQECPGELSLRIRLAELWSAAGQTARAVLNFDIAAQQLKASGRTADYIKVAERILFHDSTRLDIAKDLAKRYLANGDRNRGLAKLQVCYREDPEDIEVLEMLGHALEQVGLPMPAADMFLESARLHVLAGHVKEGFDACRQVLRLRPHDGEAVELLAELETLQASRGGTSGNSPS